MCEAKTQFVRSKSHRNVKPIENPTLGQVTTINGPGEFAGPVANDGDVLLFLPPYSPQLAPIERVGKLTRRLTTHNHRYFATPPEVLNAVNASFAPWRRPNAVLRRLCGTI
jgi:hypothetical protein